MFSRSQAVGWRERIVRFCRDERGVASAVEFAMVLPLLITFYLGGVEVSQGVAVDRKVTLAARSAADLVSQATSVTTSDVNDILNATVSVVAPWPSTNLKVIVSQIKIDAQGNATIDWSSAKNTTARPQNQAVTVPTALKIANTYLIWGEVQYDYKPVIGYVITGTLPLKDQIYMRPRLSDSVTKT
jgi:Flp pilus assembly protein TadG